MNRQIRSDKKASPLRFWTQSNRNELLLFGVLAGLGAAASYFSVNIPYTEVHIDGRLAFGFMGFALLRRWWAALLLAGLLSMTGFHQVPVTVYLPANLLNIIPCLITIRLLHAHFLSRFRHLAPYGVGWLLLVLACYQLFITPLIWAVLAVLRDGPIWPAVLAGWQEQPYLVESVLVGIVSALGMTVVRSYQALHQSRQELATTLDSIGDGVIVTDAQGRITRMNPVAQTLTGWALTEAEGRLLEAVLCLVNTQTRQPVENPVGRVLQEGVVVGLANHTSLMARDGTERQIADSAAPIRQADGRLIGTVLVFRDVTEEYETRTALRESEQYQQALIQASPLAILSLNSKGQVLTWNDAARRIFGWTAAEAVGQPLPLIPTGNQEEIDSLWPRVLAGESFTGREAVFRRKNGSPIEISLSTTPIRVPGGQNTAIMAILEDMTERKRTEMALRSLAESEVHSGEDIFHFLVRKLALSLGVRYALLAHIKPHDRDTAHTIAVWSGDGYADNFSYALDGTPCHQVTAQEACFYPRHIQQLFPQDHLLVEMKAESYWGTPLRDGAGNVLGILAVLDDRPMEERSQTLALLKSFAARAAAELDRQQVEQRLKAGERRFRSFVENANDIVYALTPEGIFTYISPNWLDFMGEPAEEAIGRSFEPYVHPEDVSLCRDFLARVVRTEQKQSSVEYRVQRKDGTWRWHTSTGSPLHNEAGQVVSCVGIARDVTERKQVEEALRQSEARYRSLTENFPNGALFLFDQNFRYLAANGKAFVRAGLSSEEVVGKRVSDVFPDLWDFMRPYHQRALQGQEAYYEVQYKGRLYSNQVVPVTSEAGVASHGIVITQDITDQKRAEEEQAKLQAQYQQAQKMESIGRLAGGVAHDLNNLLTPILGYGELLLEGFDEEDVRKADSEKIVQAAGRARDLVRQLLAFSRKQELAFEPVDLNTVLDRFEKLLRRTIREDVALKLHLAPSLPLIEADIGQLEQVIMNLAVNAQDAMPDGGTLIIQTGLTELDQAYAAANGDVKPGPYVMLAVSDTGCGIDAETQQHLFEPFFTTKSSEQGTGLGLAIVYGIIKQHGGHIWVYSEPDQGATFKLYLPVAETTQRERQEISVSPATNLSGSETILLVEDDRQVRELSRIILNRQGYRVLVAKNGVEALTILTGHAGPVHLLLTDVVLPGMNGRELFNQISRQRPALKVLYMSGYTDEVIAHRGVLEEGVNFIQKPFSVQTLAAKVREVLDEDDLDAGAPPHISTIS